MYKWVSLPRGIASVAPPNKPQTTLSQRAPYIGHLEWWLVCRFSMTILEAGLIPIQPASDLFGKLMTLNTKKISFHLQPFSSSLLQYSVQLMFSISTFQNSPISEFIFFGAHVSAPNSNTLHMKMFFIFFIISHATIYPTG